MKILILQYSTKLRSDDGQGRQYVSPGNYVQFVDPMINKPEDIAKVKWDVAIIDRNLKLSEKDAAKWIQALNVYCSMVVQLH